MEDNWKSEVFAQTGTNVFFLEGIGSVVGSIDRTNEGTLFISAPRAVNPQALGTLPGSPDKLFLYTKPLYIWPVKDPNLLGAYTKSTTGLILPEKKVIPLALVKK
jgi:hypothetical protein